MWIPPSICLKKQWAMGDALEPRLLISLSRKPLEGAACSVWRLLRREPETDSAEGMPGRGGHLEGPGLGGKEGYVTPITANHTIPGKMGHPV